MVKEKNDPTAIQLCANLLLQLSQPHMTPEIWVK
jgi:hypothetical protein